MTVVAKIKKAQACPLNGIYLDQLGPPTPPRWLVKKWLSASVFAVLYGDPGSYKSFVATDLGLSVAADRQWLGNRVKPCSVLYLALEGQEGVKNRLRAWADHNETELPKNFKLVLEPVPLLGDDCRTPDLIAAAELMAYEGRGVPGLIIIDTLSRAMNGHDENSSMDMGKLITEAEKVKAATGATVLLVHHTGKDKAKGARGHSSLRGAADIMIEAKNDGELRAELILTKSKDSESGLKQVAEFVEIELGKDEDGDPYTSLVGVAGTPKAGGDTVSSDQTRRALNLLRDLEFGTQGRVRETEWRAACRKAKIADSDKADSHRRAFNRAKQELQELDVIEVSGVEVWTRDKRDMTGTL